MKKQISISMTPELEEIIRRLRETDEYRTKSQSDIIRHIIQSGLAAHQAETHNAGHMKRTK